MMRVTSQILNLENFVQSYTDDQASQCECRLESLENCWKQFEKLQTALEDAPQSDEELTLLLKERSDMYDRYCVIKGHLTSSIQDMNSTVIDTKANTTVPVAASPHLHLPKISLPTFDGKVTEWLSFKDRFTAMIASSSDIPDVMKLEYLLASLKGDVSKRFEYVDIAAENYKTTWKALLERYDNIRSLKREYFKAIFNVPPMKDDSIEELRRVTDEFTRLTQGASKLNEPIVHWDTPLSNLLLYKLDHNTVLSWEQFSASDTTDSFPKLIEFLQTRIRILAAPAQVSLINPKPSTSKVAGNKQTRSLANASVASTSIRCHACDQSHLLYQCEMFKAMNVNDRRKLVNSNRLCFNCFRNGHAAKGCRSAHKCFKCKRNHHTLLHLEESTYNNDDRPMSEQVESTSHICTNNLTVFLQTAAVQVIDDTGKSHQVRALLDSGSMSNFMSTALAKRLSNKMTNTNICIAGIGQRESNINRSVEATVSSNVQQFSMKMHFLVIDSPTAELPTVKVDTTKWNINNVVLADPLFHTPGPIDIVIGCEAYWLVHCPEKLSIGPNHPSLINTKFGWTLAGSVPIKAVGNRQSSNVATHPNNIEESIQRFWELDTIPASAAHPNDHDPCEQLFKMTTIRNEEGRFVVKLPKTSDPESTLGESRNIAERRFYNTERRLQRNPNIYEQYRQFMDLYEKLGHMSLIPEPVNDSIAHCYLPHHPVLKDSSTTTKLRVVFDASCSTESGYSLNNILRVGPTVQQDLFFIILRFRSYAVALSADIEKMYRQVLIDPEDQALQRILWRPDSTQPLRCYELKTVTYGTASAPFLATRSLKQIALDTSSTQPTIADAIENNFYVDDFMAGAQDEQTATTLQHAMTSLLKQYGFILRKWASNSKRVLSNIADEDLAIRESHDLLAENTVTTLGVTWTPQEDVFSYKSLNSLPPPVVNRRKLLSCVSQIFDPLGLVGPVICKAKLMMQQAWSVTDESGKQYDWDKPLPMKLQNAWKSFHQNIHLLKTLRIPRYIFGKNGQEYELHFFGDASEKAYGACCYVRVVSENEIHSNLLVSKSKVAPISTRHTIARLELCAALLCIRLLPKVLAAIKRNPTKVMFWTDSTTVLQWLQATPARWKTFVANRTSQILEESDVSQWHHVAGTDNPADDISRGMDPSELLHSSRWWFGPSWLSEKSDKWPSSSITNTDMQVANEECRSPTIVAMAAVASSFCDKLFTSYSKFSKLLRAVAYYRRFIVYLQHRKDKKKKDDYPKSLFLAWLTTEELKAAEKCVCSLHQQQMYPEELHGLKKNRAISRSSPLRWVNPILLEDGLMHIGGRLRNANIPTETKHPIILSSKHPLALLLVRDCHRKLLHAGPQLMLATLRQKYWILGARDLIRNTYHRCITCFRKRPSLVTQPIADLPSSRVQPARPFAISGVDYCGPFFVKFNTRRSTPRKVYIVIFVCFTTRAVHVEVASDLSTAAFIAVLQRFISRRGRVDQLHSDNGTAFKGASHQLHDLYAMLKVDAKARETIFNWCAINEITWKFIPPRAPQFGGLWEAAVKSVKTHLLKELGTTPIIYEDFMTLCTQIEMCLNSRPLTPIPTETDDIDVLTPGHFLVGSSFQMVPEVNLTNIPDNRLSHWKHTQKMLQSIWSRWYPEYLQQLQGRTTNRRHPTVKINVGRVVIVKEDNIPPAQWPLGVITALHPGKDDVVRVVSLRTPRGKIITRPVTRIALLPINDELK